MPICTIHLLALSVPLRSFLDHVQRIDPAPLVVSRVIRWIVSPSILSISPLLEQTPSWDVVVILNSATKALPKVIEPCVKRAFVLQAGVPSRIVDTWSTTNDKLLHPYSLDIPPLTGALNSPRIAASSQELELTDELRQWMKTWDPQGKKGAVSMLNLLAFKEGMHEEYLKYGKAFAESIGSKRGGVAKIVGKVIENDQGVSPVQHDGSKDGWEEIALAHYPTAMHFADMLASEDYQTVNHRDRVGSLKDTCILCTSELDLVADDPPSYKL